TIPTITTTLSGFGHWVLGIYGSEKQNDLLNGVYVISRDEDNHEQVIDQIAEAIANFSNLSLEKVQLARTNAKELSKKAEWTEFVKFYIQGYDIGLTKNVERYKLVETKVFKRPLEAKIDVRSNEPKWKKMRILTNIPKPIEGLVDLSMNVWWSWNYEASQLFKLIDKDIWERSKKNPIVLLNSISQERLL
ncbi:MAG TPA: DUF3417 domain-containing protein, partial [Salinivirgaceae bacterium]|nr:DUF3417 domain-containing protein [Salinivirgaceae bacterium]